MISNDQLLTPEPRHAAISFTFHEGSDYNVFDIKAGEFSWNYSPITVLSLENDDPIHEPQPILMFGSNFQALLNTVANQADSSHQHEVQVQLPFSTIVDCTTEEREARLEIDKKLSTQGRPTPVDNHVTYTHRFSYNAHDRTIRQFAATPQKAGLKFHYLLKPDGHIWKIQLKEGNDTVTLSALNDSDRELFFNLPGITALHLNRHFRPDDDEEDGHSGSSAGSGCHSAGIRLPPIQPKGALPN